jgi:hypothetical protein
MRSGERISASYTEDTEVVQRAQRRFSMIGAQVRHECNREMADDLGSGFGVSPTSVTTPWAPCNGLSLARSSMRICLRRAEALQ